MKKVYVMAAALVATFGALSVGSASFASVSPASIDSVPGSDDTVPSTDDSVPSTDSTTTTDDSTTTSSMVTTTNPASDTTTTPAPSGLVDTTEPQSGAVTTTIAVGNSVAQEAPLTTTTTTPRSASDGLLPNTGSGVAIPLMLAALAAGTGAATLLVRRRSVG